MKSETWARPRPEIHELRADFALAALLAFASVTTSMLYSRIGLFEELPSAGVWALGLGLVCLPLWFRRRYPIAVMIVVSVGFYICGTYGVPEVLITNISMFVAVYSVGAWSQNRSFALWSRVGVIAAMILWLIVTLIISAADVEFMPGLSRSSIFSAYAIFIVIQIITNLMFFGGATYFGEKAFRSARLLSSLNAQGKQLDLERQSSAAQAVALDRLAIARELHDVIAHHVSVMGLHAAAARRTLGTDPDKSVAALEIVEESAHQAINELRQVVHTLREPESPLDSSTVGVAQLAGLVESEALSGVQTTLIVAGEPRPIPMLVDVALYRVVQEALTNVRKHAGAGSSAEVRLRYTSDLVEVEVSDNGFLRAAKSNEKLGGLGLRGMRERLGAVGGSLIAEHRERGGFIVRASVPLNTPVHLNTPAPLAKTAPASETASASGSTTIGSTK